MKKKAIIICLAALFISQWVAANPIGSVQALRNAQDFLRMKGIPFTPSVIWRAPMADIPGEEAPFYVFNLGSDGGFVIASGDDRAFPILGYSDKGHLATDSLPENVSYWLDFYKAQIKARKNYATAIQDKPYRESIYHVAPLLSSHWDQDVPYNLTCPTTSEGSRCITGCVATAMAQVMYYHRKNSTHQVMADIPGYDDIEGDMVTVKTVPKGSLIDWDNMVDDYSGDYTEKQAMAVANLMLYCGTSVNMDYGIWASGGKDYYLPTALIKYFDYDDDTRIEERYMYSDQEWEDMVKEELAQGNPIYYVGYPQETIYPGHAFVVDGHDEHGFVHVNWGWGGDCDGYFRLTTTTFTEDMQQDYEAALDGYSESQRALFGANPNGDSDRLTTLEITLKSADTVDGLSSMPALPLSFSMTVANLVGRLSSFEQAIGLYQNGELKNVVAILDLIKDLPDQGSKTVNVTLNLDASLANGVYQLRPISRNVWSSKWRWNGNYDQFFTLAIHDDKAVITVGKPPVEGDIITFADCKVKKMCVENWDINGDEELSQQEAAAVKSLDRSLFKEDQIKTFDELQYFTGLTAIDDSLFFSCENLSSVKIPPHVASIGESAFSYTGIHDFTIPASVTRIGPNAFNCNSFLEDIRVEEGNTVFDSRDNCHALIETASNTLLTGCSISFIPDGIKTIGARALEDSHGLTDISIPVTVTTLALNAFKFCDNLQSIIIPKDVTSIGNMAFYGCSKLKFVSIPSLVESIGWLAFGYCKALTSVEVKRPEPLTIANDRFENYADITLYVPKGSRSAYMAADNWNLFGKIVELSGIKGDINQDGEVALADVVMTVNAILGKEGAYIPLEFTDMDGDGTLTVGDVVAIVYIILNN